MSHKRKRDSAAKDLLLSALSHYRLPRPDSSAFASFSSLPSLSLSSSSSSSASSSSSSSSSHVSPTSLLLVPDELLRLVFPFLNGGDLFSLSRTCRALRVLLSMKSSWAETTEFDMSLHSRLVTDQLMNHYIQSHIPLP